MCGLSSLGWICKAVGTTAGAAAGYYGGGAVGGIAGGAAGAAAGAAVPVVGTTSVGGAGATAAPCANIT
jgi:hypothetical protein